MPTLLFPGRHLLHTRFQQNYLAQFLPLPVEQWPLLGPRCFSGKIDELLFAITSANQSNSRFNPIPLDSRAIGVDRFAQPFRPSLRCPILPIPHFAPTARYAEFLLKEIAEATECRQCLRPDNTIILSSTPDLIRQFIALGFGVLPAELTALEPPHYSALTPIELLKSLVTDPQNPSLLDQLSPATLSLWQDFPDILPRILRLYQDPLLTDQGNLTEKRNYSTYADAMSNRAILDLKYHDIHSAILPGRIADEGCADGALLVPIARDFPDSDLIGIELTGEFLARCIERQRALEYGGTYIHFHQRNLTDPIFQPGSIDTTICNSTTHELWSYASQEPTLRAYLAEKFRQTRKGGRLIIRDVVGPEDADAPILLWCNPDDGINTNIHAQFPTAAALQQHLDLLSTAARFARFAEDYLANQRLRRHLPKLHYSTINHNAIRYFQLPLRHAMEFLLKKDYTSNWSSELNEEFTYWSFPQWKSALTNAGFAILEGPTDSRTYTNPWIITHRFTGKVELLNPQTLAPIPYPPTTMILVAEKPS